MFEIKISETSDRGVLTQYDNAKNELEDSNDFMTDSAILRRKVKL